MHQEHQPVAENSQGSDQNNDSFTGPYRHKGYRRALEQLREALCEDNAVILKGVEGTGKSTLVAELISEYEHKGVPVAVLTKALPKASHFYAILADTLGVPKQKTDLIRALRNTKEAGQFCFVVVDQDAINSAPEVEDALKQLCLSSETTAGAIRLVVVRKDYLVIHTDGTPEADFHNWIDKEVCLDPLHTDDIEGFIYYLSSIKGIQPTPYEIGTDFLMIEKTEGRISRLKGMLLPLIHKDVITRHDIQGLSKSSVKANKNSTRLLAAAFVVFVAAGIGINHFILNKPQAPQAITHQTPAPVFAEVKPETRQDNAVTLPNLVAEIESPKPTAGSSGIASTAQATEASAVELQLQQPEVQKAKLKTQSAPESITSTPLAKPSTSPSMMDEQKFQNEVKEKLLLIEDQLSAAIAENKRLKAELAEAQEKQQASIINAEPISEQPPLVPESDNVAAVEAEEITTAVTEKEQVAAQEVSDQDQLNDLQLTVAPSKDNAQPPATAISATSSAVEPVVDVKEEIQPVSDMEKAIATVIGWQSAWQQQDHASYIAFYKTGFNGAYKTHQQWLKKRHTALTKPGQIKLTRSEFVKTFQNENSIKLDFWLTYEADSGYKDKTHKRLTLEQQGDTWLIVREQNIKVEPFF